jgi:N-acyl-D-amino-acid deacylase
MKTSAVTTLLLLLVSTAQAQQADLLLRGGRVLDGAGNPWVRKDVAITGDRITFVGDARAARIQARETVDVSGLTITPGLWDVHSHADLVAPVGRQALPLLYQGVTTVVVGVDGDGNNNIREIFDGYRRNGIAVNAVRYVGQGAARGQAMGSADRAATPAELEAMKAYIRRGMDEGAVGLSTGLFYAPGFFASTEEVIALNRVAAEYGGRANEGAKLIDEARARGVNVMAGQHTFNATNSSVSAYALPRYAVVGGPEAMKQRFRDPASRAQLTKEIMEMLEPRGGASKLLFSDRRADLNGRTLTQIAESWKLSVPDAVMRILEQGNVNVMNLELYDDANTRYLARMEWMMTCTDGYTPADTMLISHPRSYASFTRKMLYAVRDSIITLPFAVRGMTSLSASFYGFANRGQIAEGYFADIAVFDLGSIRETTTYERPHQYSQGTVHVLVNGRFAFRNGRPTGTLAGRPLPRERSP